MKQIVMPFEWAKNRIESWPRAMKNLPNHSNGMVTEKKIPFELNERRLRRIGERKKRINQQHCETESFA